MTTDAAAIASFYRCAVLGLRALDAQGGRGLSFGDDADRRWKELKGELDDRDRIDLLLRNAARTKRDDGTFEVLAAFAPREVFALEGLAADEPCGPDWRGPDAALAPPLLRAAPPADLSASAVLAEAARLWGVAPLLPPSDLLRSFNPATRVLAAGSGAVFALAEATRTTPGADLAAQVLLVADRPAERQLLGLAAVLLGSTRRTHALAPSATAAHAKQAGFAYVNVALVSDDAPPEARAAAERLARELGA